MNDYDFGILKELAYDACLKTYELLSELTGDQLGTRVRTVFRPNDNNGMTGYHAFLPNYHSALTYDKFCEIWDSEETLNFLSKLSECPLLPEHMMPDSDNMSSWNRMYAGQLIQSSLDRALDRTSIIYFIDGSNNPEAWSLEKSILIEVINNSIEELIENPANNIHYIKAICPIQQIEFSSNEIYFSEEVRIRKWSIRERAILISTYHDAFLWQEYMPKHPTFSEYFIELKLNIEPGKSIHEVIVNYIDSLNWAIMMSAQSEHPPSEGACLVLTKSGSRLNSIRRDDSLNQVAFNLDSHKTNSCISLFSDVNKSITDNYGLDKALWHFGRSCTSSVERDVLLEAAIGIDSIVSKGGGDSLYKFCLHGSALLTAVDENISVNIFDDLKNIYGRRSSAAHGTGSISNSQSDLPGKTRFYLAKMIQSVLTLNKQGILIINKDSKVADAVQIFVIDNVITNAKKTQAS